MQRVAWIPKRIKGGGKTATEKIHTALTRNFVNLPQHANCSPCTQSQYPKCACQQTSQLCCCTEMLCLRFHLSCHKILPCVSQALSANQTACPTDRPCLNSTA